MRIDLTTEEVALIRKLIEREVSDLGPEIHHTNTSSVREELKSYRVSLNSLSAKLEQQ